jgi:hypothetical protein
MKIGCIPIHSYLSLMLRRRSCSTSAALPQPMKLIWENPVMPRSMNAAMLLLLILGFMTTADSNAQLWLNETGQALEADFANLQYPSTINIQTSQQTDFIYGQLYEAGLTEAAGEPPNVIASLGYGPLGSDPRSHEGWSWVQANYNVQVGHNDEYSFKLTAPATPGTYSYSYRYSLDNGSSWTAADLDGAGANVGLAFSTMQLGVMTVTAGSSSGVDFCNLQFPATLNLLAQQPSGRIYGTVYEGGLTSLPGEPDGIIANIGLGPAGTDPRTSNAWTWNAANYNAQIGSNDEFFGSLTAPAVNGTYHYAYRFSLDGGTTWAVGDLDGNGTNDGLSFSLAQLGVLTVTGGLNPVFNPADFNQDTFVNSADLTTWKNSYGPGNGADADDDGRSNGVDFLRWQRELGATAASAAAAAVPEPACASLVAYLAMVGFSRRGRGILTRSA